MAIFRRTDLGQHEALHPAALRALKQRDRDGGDDDQPGGLWGNISGQIDNQSDLKIVRDNLEALAMLMDS